MISYLVQSVSQKVRDEGYLIGYEESLVNRVKNLHKKRNIKKDMCNFKKDMCLFDRGKVPPHSR